MNKKNLTFFIMGLSHQGAPVELREKFTAQDDLEKLLYKSQNGESDLAEVLILSTCNRLEILAVSRQLREGKKTILNALSQISGLSEETITPHLHQYDGLEAAKYLFRVAASLDSQVLGEAQILGQVKNAFRQAHEHHRAGFIINKLMHRCFRAAKRVRSETCLAGGSVSIAGAAVALAKDLGGGDLRRHTALILGAGPMAALAAAHLQKKHPARLTIMNRSRVKAETLAAEHGAQCRPWAELEAALVEADLIIAATGADRPILTLGNMERIMALRNKALTVIDIGVPRNAAHDLKNISQVILRNIDDLNDVVWESRESRRQAAQLAEAIIEEETAKFGLFLESLASQPLVSALAQKAENIRKLELTRTLNQNNFSPEQITSLEAMTAALMRRLLHDPLHFIKNASTETNVCAAPNQCQVGTSCLKSIRRAFKIEH